MAMKRKMKKEVSDILQDEQPTQEIENPIRIKLTVEFEAPKDFLKHYEENAQCIRNYLHAIAYDIDGTVKKVVIE